MCDKGHFGMEVKRDCRIAICNRSYDQLKTLSQVGNFISKGNMALTIKCCVDIRLLNVSAKKTNEKRGKIVILCNNVFLYF